ncbi:unnamed protein product [Prunus armeniaca]|uniref:Uncharacterized protein n=1 Tax=Prunus armeniaca TaxID=36596 RepID=A0A6J5V657_PRUAR|nr:unnamed protein product [Prunus armeniaca]
MEDEGNSSLLPPSDIKSKKEQPEMLSDLIGDFNQGRPSSMLPPQEAETFLVKKGHGHLSNTMSE